jgi:hypothetical protein
MSTTFTWAVKPNGLLTQTISNNENTVTNVLYTVQATDGTNTTTYNGMTQIPFNPDVSFTPYSSLTQDQVIGWVKTELGTNRVTQIETMLTNQLTTIANPPARPTAQALPW